MKGWVWKQNQTVGEALENNSGEWTRNEFDENNPCERMKPLWAAIESNPSDEQSSLWKDIKPFKDLVFTEINKIIFLNEEPVHVFVYSDSSDIELDFFNSNNVWDLSNYTSNIYKIQGNGTIPIGIINWSNYYIDQSYDIDINSCMFSAVSADLDSNSQSYSFDSNVINITFSQLLWCNIDRLLSEYGQINSCKSKGNFSDHAQVKIVFKDLNGALSCDFSVDGFVANRLPEGYNLTFLVYYKDGDTIKYGTQTITAAEEMTFNEENLKTLTDMDTLVEEIEKLVD